MQQRRLLNSLRRFLSSGRKATNELHTPAEAFREAMASIGSQAMILTAPFEGSLNHSTLHGMTLSSVSSLTINPEPLLQFNLQIPSKTSETLHQLSYLALHILKPTVDSVNLARVFSRGTKPKTNELGQIEYTKPFEELHRSEWDVYDIAKKSFPLSLPILTKNSERILICEKHEVFRVYNHEIWTCKVRDILVDSETQSDKSGGLLYFNRHFHQIGTPFKE